MKITRQKIKNFISGNTRKIASHFGIGEHHLIEQVAYRESKCPDCAKEGHCLGDCSCRVPGRWFVDRTCNLKRFPNLMEADEWEVYKKNNGIIVEK